MNERSATREDLSAVVELFCRYEQAVRGAPDTDDGDVAGDWDEPGFDMATGTLVLEQDGRLLGYAVVNGDGEADTVAEPGSDPAVRERLVAWLEERPGHLEHYTADEDPEAGALLEGRGWEPARRFWRMRRELDAPTPEPRWPDGVVVRGLRRPDDERVVHALVQTCFAEIGGQHERSFETWSSWLLDNDRFDPELCLVAERDGAVVGVSLSQDLGEYGFVRQLAVARPERGRGLALALLHECFRRHAARGLPATVLGVDAANPTGALALYEKAGMRVHERFTRWERDVPAPG